MTCLDLTLNGSGIFGPSLLRGQALLEELKAEFEERVAAEAAKAAAEAEPAKAESGEAAARIIDGKIEVS